MGLKWRSTGEGVCMRVLPRSAGFVLMLASNLALAQAPYFSLVSPDFGPKLPMAASHILNGYGCTGQNRSPALEWRGHRQGRRVLRSPCSTWTNMEAPRDGGIGWSTTFLGRRRDSQRMLERSTVPRYRQERCKAEPTSGRMLTTDLALVRANRRIDI